MFIVTIDTTVFIKILNEARKHIKTSSSKNIYENYLKQSDRNILFLCILIEALKKCDNDIMHVHPDEELMDDEDYNKIEQKVLKLRDDFYYVVCNYNMDVFPHLSRAIALKESYKVLRVRTKDDEYEFKEFLLDLIIRWRTRKQLRIYKDFRDEYIQNYNLKKYAQNFKNLIIQHSEELWMNINHTRHILSTYLKAKEEWENIHILSSDLIFKKLQLNFPDIFKVIYVKNNTQQK